MRLRVKWALLLGGLLLLAGAVGFVLLQRRELADGYLSAGLDKFRQGAYQSALGEFTMAILLDPEREAPYLERALAFRALARPQEAIKDLSRAIGINAHNPNSHYLRGRLRAEPLEEFRDAIRDFDRTIALAPDHARAYYARGLAYRRLNNPRFAVKDFSRAIDLQPDFFEAILQRAEMYRRTRQFHRAVEDLSRAIGLRPGDVGLYRLRGRLHMSVEGYRQASADLTRVARNAPSPEVYFDRATAYLKLGEYGNAIADYTQTIALQPAHISARLNRATAYAALGRNEEARRDWIFVCLRIRRTDSKACRNAAEGAGS